MEQKTNADSGPAQRATQENDWIGGLLLNEGIQRKNC
jgi:hypothetical protein